MYRLIIVPKMTRRLSKRAFAFVQIHATVFAIWVVTYFSLQFIAYKKAGN